MYLTIYRGSEIRDIAAVDYTAALRDEGWVLINPNPPLVPTSNADWNATSGDAQILNKPTLGTAAATNSTDYATAAQGAKADTALQPAEIGSTVLAYDANLQSFVDTFALPVADGTAGQVLATNGAGVLSFATSTLNDPAYIGGVAYFNRSTKPTERSAGVPLVVGDKWYNPTDQTDWVFQGTYWVSEALYTFNTDTATVTSAGASYVSVSVPEGSWICHSAEIQAGQIGGGGTQNWDESNYFTISLNLVSRATMGGPILVSGNITSNTGRVTSTSPVVRLADDASITLRIYVDARIGNPINGQAFGVCVLRKIA